MDLDLWWSDGRVLLTKVGQVGSRVSKECREGGGQRGHVGATDAHPRGGQR